MKSKYKFQSVSECPLCGRMSENGIKPPASIIHGVIYTIYVHVHLTRGNVIAY